MSVNISENLKELAAYGVIAGVIGIVGYVLKAAYNMNNVADKIGKSVDEISNSVHVDVSEAVAVEAVQRAAEKESVGIVARASKEAVNAVRDDIQKEVKEAVNKAYSSVKDDVRRELERKIDALNLDDIKADIIEGMKDAATEKLDDAMDDILEEFNGNLKNVAKIYKSISKAMTGDD